MIILVNLLAYVYLKLFYFIHYMVRCLIIFFSQLQARAISFTHVPDIAGKVRKVWLLDALLLHKSVIRSDDARNIEHILDLLQFLREVLTIFTLMFITIFPNGIPYPVLKHVHVICSLVFSPLLQLFL